jgi:hypothetical protein
MIWKFFEETVVFLNQKCCFLIQRLRLQKRHVQKFQAENENGSNWVRCCVYNKGKNKIAPSEMEVRGARMKERREKKGK